MPIPTRTLGCSWRPLTRADLPDLADLVAAIEYLDDTPHLHPLEDVEAAFDRSEPTVERNSVLLRTEEGVAVAYGWNRVAEPGEPQGRVYLAGGCHPGWRHRGVGATLLTWQLERAREWHEESGLTEADPLEVVTVAEARNVGECTMLHEAGFRPQRWQHDFHQYFDPQAPALHASPVDGVTLAHFDDEHSERVRLLHNACAATRPGAREVGRQEWAAELRSPLFRRDLSWVALGTGGEVVGHALNSLSGASDGLGWTDRLGALPALRNRGLLSVLLTATLTSFREAGLIGAGIGVDIDSSSGVRPYEAMGYGSAETLVWYVRRDPARYSGDRNSEVNQDGQ